MRSLEGKSVLVTGGGSGLGEAVARHFAAQGARVTISGRRAERLAVVAASIGGSCRAVSGDVSVAADRARMLAAVAAGRCPAHRGGRPVPRPGAQ